MKYCTKCGNQLEDEMLFCQKCGTKVKIEPTQEPTSPQYDVLGMSEISEPIKAKKSNKQSVRTVGTVVLVFFLIIMFIVVGTKGRSSTSNDNLEPSSQSTVKSGEDYESLVWDAFWESASDFFGVEYSSYKMWDTVYSHIQDFETSNGYTSHYYLIRTAFETTNVLGNEITHQVTARCYYVPDYSDTVYLAYMTLNGETVFFDEETEDWLMGMGEAKAEPASTNKESVQSTNENDTQVAESKNTTKNTQPTSKPAFTGNTCFDINSNGMPASNVTNFSGEDDICLAGRLTGLTGENNVKIIWTCPDGHVFTDQQYCYTDGDALQSWKTAEEIGSGSASVSIVLDTTGQTLATYNFTVTGAPTYINETEYSNDSYYESDEEMNEINKKLAEQEYLKNLPSLDEVIIENETNENEQNSEWVSEHELEKTFGMTTLWDDSQILIMEYGWASKIQAIIIDKSDLQTGIPCAGDFNEYSITVKYDGTLYFNYDDLVAAGII